MKSTHVDVVTQDLNFNRKAEMRYISKLNVAPQLGQLLRGETQNGTCSRNKET